MTSAAALDPDLCALAAAHGVATSYENWAGQPTPVSAEAVVAALAALDVAAASSAEICAALTDVADAPWRRLLPPTVVVRGGPAQVEVRLAAGEGLTLEVQAEGAEGSTVVTQVPPSGAGRRSLEVALPQLAVGYYRLTARATSGRVDEAAVIVAPRQLAAGRAEERAWGWMVQLYSLRSADSWAIGDYADLRTVAEHSAAAGARVLLVNPLHAETPVLPITNSPYSPSSRRFRSPLYLRICALPEYERAAPGLQEEVAGLRPRSDPDRIDRDAAWAAKRAALQLLWPLHDPAALAAFRAERGAGLEEFALFCALAERHGGQWQIWPEGVRSPQSEGVPAAAAELADEIAFWCWLQLQVERQLEHVAATGVLVIHDLAVGVDASGADAWALQDALATGSTVGAPPDSFNQQGQDWGLPPWRPDRLRECGFAPYREMVRACLRSAGGLRIDHVMGLFRLWWAPPGGTAADGTYLSYDADAMLAVLTIEASRVGALIVGEDLGTVSDTVRSELAATGILGSAVLWFERADGGAGKFLPPQEWRELAMASVTTHDLPTAAGFLADEHVRVRAELDQLAVPVAQEYERVHAERDALVQMLTAAGLLGVHEGDVVLAMHDALVQSPCRLVVGAFGDAVGDLRQPNLPGTVDAYPNWRLPVADSSGRPLLLEELLAHPGVQRLSGVLSGCTLGSDTVPP